MVLQAASASTESSMAGNHATVRNAYPEDIPFLARMDVEASLPPFGVSFWDELLAPTGTPAPAFLEVMFRLGASNWGNLPDFIVLEQDGVPAATCAVYRPAAQIEAAGPLNLSHLHAVAERLGWTAPQEKDFRSAYTAMWAGDMSMLAPHADAIIETVAVAPGFRGRGLGHRLIEAAFERARDLGARTVGIMVIHGNDKAQALYERHFERWTSFHAAFFDHAFPGVTKYRANLSIDIERTT